MFNFLNRSQPRFPTISQALVEAGLSAVGDPSLVAVVEKHGQYAGRRLARLGDGHAVHAAAQVQDVGHGRSPSAEVAGEALEGRRVNFFRAFKPGQQDLLLGSGHVEREGLVVLNSRPQPEGPPPTRQPADRTTHANYEHLIFWDADAAQSSASAMSGPAAKWLHARSTPHTAEQ